MCLGHGKLPRSLAILIHSCGALLRDKHVRCLHGASRVRRSIPPLADIMQAPPTPQELDKLVRPLQLKDLRILCRARGERDPGAADDRNGRCCTTYEFSRLCNIILVPGTFTSFCFAGTNKLESSNYLPLLDLSLCIAGLTPAGVPPRPADSMGRCVSVPAKACLDAAGQLA